MTGHTGSLIDANEPQKTRRAANELCVILEVNGDYVSFLGRQNLVLLKTKHFHFACLQVIDISYR